MINPRLFPKGSHDRKTLIKILFCLRLLKQESRLVCRKDYGFRSVERWGCKSPFISHWFHGWLPKLSWKGRCKAGDLSELLPGSWLEVSSRAGGSKIGRQNQSRQKPLFSFQSVFRCCRHIECNRIVIKNDGNSTISHPEAICFLLFGNYTPTA